MAELINHAFSKKQGIFVDVGVNLGQSLLKVKAADQEREYLGFEPNPACVYYVSVLVRVNKLNHCTIIPAAVSSNNGIAELSLYDSGLTNSSASIVENARPDMEVYSKQHIATVNGDTVSKLVGNRAVGFLKIDVEGGEVDVVRELEHVLARDRPFIAAEVLPATHANEQHASRKDELENILARVDYRIFKVEAKKSRHLRGLKQLDYIDSASRWFESDYVFVPAEALDTVSALRV